MYEALKVPLSMTWEIYGDNSASYEDCFKMFNPVTPQAFKVGVMDVGARCFLTKNTPLAL